MATLMMASGEILDVSPANGRDFQLRELQKMVEGYIEIVPLRDPKDGRTVEHVLVLNEEGKIKGLPYNAAATEVWRMYYGHTDLLVGNVLQCRHNEVR